MMKVFFVKALTGYTVTFITSQAVHSVIGVDNPLSGKVIVRGLATGLIYLGYFLGASYKRGEI